MRRHIAVRSTAVPAMSVGGRPPADELPRTAENLHVLAEFAGKLGVRLVIEPMSRFRIHLVNTAAQAVDLVRLADHANLRVNLDTYHMITEERDYGAAMRCALPCCGASMPARTTAACRAAGWCRGPPCSRRWGSNGLRCG